MRRVAFIIFAQKVGLSLDEIRGQLAMLPKNRTPDRADWAKLSPAWQLANPQDRLDRRGPGPRIWIGGTRLSD